MFASGFVPLLHLDDHPMEDRYALSMKISLPEGTEAFARERYPESERIELCHAGKQVVVHRGWTPITEGCVATGDDTTVGWD